MVSKSLILFLFLPQAITGDIVHKCVASDSVKKLMKKHGINTMYQDWDGKWWFKRGGKKVIVENGE